MFTSNLVSFHRSSYDWKSQCLQPDASLHRDVFIVNPSYLKIRNLKHFKTIRPSKPLISNQNPPEMFEGLPASLERSLVGHVLIHVDLVQTGNRTTTVSFSQTQWQPSRMLTASWTRPGLTLVSEDWKNCLGTCMVDFCQRDRILSRCQR